MAGLLDIAALSETVDIRGNAIVVHGVSAKGIAHLLSEFPELRMLMSGRSIDTDNIMEMGADIVAAIIAAGIGFPGDKEQEKAAANLSLTEQADLLEKILKLTMPQGVGPFMDRLMSLMGTVGVKVDQLPEAQATK